MTIFNRIIEQVVKHLHDLIGFTQNGGGIVRIAAGIAKLDRPTFLIGAVADRSDHRIDHTLDIDGISGGDMLLDLNP